MIGDNHPLSDPDLIPIRPLYTLFMGSIYNCYGAVIREFWHYAICYDVNHRGTLSVGLRHFV